MVRPLLLPSLALLLACQKKGASEASIIADASEVPLSGYTPVSFDLSESGLSAGEVISATVAGINTYNLAADGDTLTLTVQGAPDPGPAEVVLTDADGVATSFADALTYAAPLDPRFQRIVAVGASLGMGVESVVPTQHGQLHDPPAVIARQLGGWLPLPLLVEDLFTGVQPDDIGPPPGCTLPDVWAIADAAASTALGAMRDPDTNDFGFPYGRIDADIPMGNLSVAGSGVSDVLHGPGDFGETFLSHLVFDPYADIGDEITGAQIDRVEEIAPTLVLSVDLTGNDLIDMVTGEALDPSLATDRPSYAADTAALMARFGALDAEVFLANSPDVNVMPLAHQTAVRMGEAGTDATSITALQEETRGIVQDYNQILADAAAPYPNVHIVDIFTATDALVADGITVGDQNLSTNLLDGLLSLDGIHFSDTGYAVMANAFIDQINADLGTDVPSVDLEAVLAEDPFSPDALAAEGLEPGACAP